MRERKQVAVTKAAQKIEMAGQNARRLAAIRGAIEKRAVREYQHSLTIRAHQERRRAKDLEALAKAKAAEATAANLEGTEGGHA